MTKRTTDTSTQIGAWTPVADLRRWARNPRRNDGAVARVAESIRRFGFIAPVVVWTSQSRIVAGDTRLKALQQLLRDDPAFVPPGAPAAGVVPVRFHEFASEQEANAYAIADNRLGEIAQWDETALSELLTELDAFDPSLVSVAYGTAEEIEALLGDVATGTDDGLLDPTGEHDEAQTSIATLKFGKKILQLTEAEADQFQRALDGYVEEHGTTHGFVGWLLRDV